MVLLYRCRVRFEKGMTPQPHAATQNRLLLSALLHQLLSSALAIADPALAAIAACLLCGQWRRV